MTLFRTHRGSLEDSMNTCIEVNSLNELFQYVNDNILPINDGDIFKINYYTRDNRINWDTYIVTLNGNALGFTNGPLE